MFPILLMLVLLGYWYPKLKARLFYRRVRSNLTHVLVISPRGEPEIRPIKFDEQGTSFRYRYTTYMLETNPDGQCWNPIEFRYR